MSIKKRFIVFFVFVLLLVVALPVTVFASDVVEISGTGKNTTSTHEIGEYGYFAKLNNGMGLSAMYCYWQWQSAADSGVEIKYFTYPHVEGSLLTMKYTMTCQIYYGKTLIFWNDTQTLTDTVTYNEFYDESDDTIEEFVRKTLRGKEKAALGVKNTLKAQDAAYSDTYWIVTAGDTSIF